MPKRTSQGGRSPLPAIKAVRADGTATLARYSKGLAAEICERIAAGEIWFKICNTGRLPSYTTLYQWLKRHPDFAEAYAQAKEMAADLRADKALAVAEGATAATVTADRLRVSTLQWHAGKAAPRRYGSRVGADVEEEGPPRELVIRVRRFERAWREDGSAYVREVFGPANANAAMTGKPSGGAVE